MKNSDIKEIEVKVLSEFDEKQLRWRRLAENFKRKELTWEESVPEIIEGYKDFASKYFDAKKRSLKGEDHQTRGKEFCSKYFDVK